MKKFKFNLLAGTKCSGKSTRSFQKDVSKSDHRGMGA